MNAQSRNLASTASSACGLIFTVAIFLYQDSVGSTAVPGESLLAGVVAAVLALSIFFSLLLVDASDSQSAGPIDRETPPSPGPRRATAFMRRHAGPLTVLGVVVVLAFTLSTIQVASVHDSGRWSYSLSPSFYPPCNITIGMGGFGQIVFNWSEPIPYDSLSIDVFGPHSVHLFHSAEYSNQGPIQGYEGLVVAPGNYYLLVEPGGTVQTVVNLVLDASYVTPQSLFAVSTDHSVPISTSSQCYASPS